MDSLKKVLGDELYAELCAEIKERCDTPFGIPDSICQVQRDFYYRKFLALLTNQAKLIEALKPFAEAAKKTFMLPEWKDWACWIGNAYETLKEVGGENQES